MKTLLLQAPVANLSPHARLSPPLGLAYVAQHLLDEGHDVEIVDFNLTGFNPARMRATLARVRPELVGISTHTETYPNALRLAALVKEHDRGVPVLMGGVHASILPRDVLSDPCVDFVAVGEGERTAVELAAALAARLPEAAFPSIAGLGFKRNGVPVLNEPRVPLDHSAIGLPARHLLSLDFYEDAHNVLVARGGCPYRCPFCSGSHVWGGRRRLRPVADVIAEVVQVVRDYGARRVFFVDDIMTLDRRWLEELMAALIAADTPVAWGCATRVDCVDDALLQRMAQAGCTGIQYGVESGAQSVLDSVKGIKRKDALAAVRSAVRHGISTSCSFMVPFPEDTEATLAETADFMAKLAEEGARLLVSYTTPFPGTRFHDRAEELGLRILHRDYNNYDCKHLVMETRHLSAQRIEELAEGMAHSLGMAQTA